jgi:hypothetical protein
LPSINIIIEEERSGSEEEEEDEDNEENEDEDEENEDDEDDEEGSGSGEGSDEEDEENSDDEEKKKKDVPPPVKLSKYQQLMNIMRDINNDLTSMDQEVDRVYSRVQTARSIKERSMRKEPPIVKRNYHEPMDKEEIKRSFSPRRRGPSDDEYDNNRYDEDLNDRAGAA